MDFIQFLYETDTPPSSDTKAMFQNGIDEILDRKDLDGNDVLRTLSTLIEGVTQKASGSDYPIGSFERYLSLGLQKFVPLLTEEKRQVFSQLLLKKAQNEKQHLRTRLRLLDTLHTFSSNTYTTAEQSGLVQEINQSILQHITTMHDEFDLNTERDKIMAYNTYLQEMTWLLSYQHGTEGEQMCKKEIERLQTEMIDIVHSKKRAFLTYLDEAMPTRERNTVRNDPPISIEERFKDVDTTKHTKIEDDLYFQGQREDVWLGMQAALKLADSNEGLTYKVHEDDYAYLSHMSDGTLISWRIEPLYNEQILLRCTTGKNTGAVLSLDTADFYDAVASSTVCTLLDKGVENKHQRENTIDELKRNLKPVKGYYTYQTNDGTLLRVHLRRSPLVTISPDQDNARAISWVMVDQFIGAGGIELLEKTREQQKIEEENRKVLEAYDYPIKELQESGHTVASIVLIPKSDGKEYSSAGSDALGDAIFRSAVLRERYGDIIQIPPPVISDNPKHDLYAAVEESFARGARVFDINIPNHGSDQYFMFEHPLRPEHLLDMVRDFVKKDPICQFNFYSMACFGGGMRYDFMRAIREDPALAQHVTMFTEVQPFAVNQVTSRKTPQTIEARDHRLFGTNNPQSGGGNPTAIFMKTLLTDETATYGKAMSEADLRSIDGDPEAIVHGNLISMHDDQKDDTVS